jgi:hypothetical protein
MDEDLIYTDLGDENFLEQVAKWKPDKHAPVRARVAERVEQLAALPERRPKGNKGGSGREAVEQSPPQPPGERERWEAVRQKFIKDQRPLGELEAATGLHWDRSRRKVKVSDYAKLSWDKLKGTSLSNAKCMDLLRLLEAAAASRQD